MSTKIGSEADTPSLVVNLYPTGAIPVNVTQNILGIIGECSDGPAMVVQALSNSQQVKQTYVSGPLCRDGVLAFFQGLQDAYMVRVLKSDFSTAEYQLEDGLGHNAGLATAASDGDRGNSVKVKFEDGTFASHDVEYFPGDGSVGPYYLEFHNLVGPWPITGTDKNWVKVDNVVRTIVYDIGYLIAGTVYVNTATGSLTFFEGQEPATYSRITCDIAYDTKKMTIIDGDTTYPAIDNLSDKAAIEAILYYNTFVHYAADPLVTHLPANGTYTLTGGDDGGAPTADTYDEAIWVMRQYLAEVKTGITVMTLCKTEVASTPDGSYDMLSLAEGHCAEMEQEWEPCLWVLGANEDEDPANFIQICSPHSHRNLLMVANPWGGERDPPRTNGWVALAAREASLALGDDSAERSSLNSLKAMQGLLMTYRKATVRGLQNNRITCLIKEDTATLGSSQVPGLFPNWSRTLGGDWQFADAVDNRTINNILRMLNYVSMRFFFKKNIPSIRDDYRRSIAQYLNQFLSQYVIVKYILEVHGPGDRGYKYTDNSRVDVNLQIENVGHIKHIFINYGVGILQDGSNVVYAPNIYSQEA